MLRGRGERITDVVWAENVAEDRRRTFEVDPRVLLRIQREARDGGDESIGVFHSHPSGDAKPSSTDLARAWQPDFIWLIMAFDDTGLVATAAYRSNRNEEAFTVLELSVRDCVME